MILNGKMLDAHQYMTYEYDTKTKKITFKIKEIVETGQFQMNIYINDSTNELGECLTDLFCYKSGYTTCDPNPCPSDQICYHNYPTANSNSCVSTTSCYYDNGPIPSCPNGYICNYCTN